MRWILFAIIRTYQYAVSPVLAPCCRHTPCCSEYALEAIQRYGTFRGSWLALKRLARCHPWGSSGFEPVPDLRGDPSRSTHSRNRMR